MRKGDGLIGKPIVTYDTGEQVGKVADLVFDLGGNKLLAVDLGEGQGPPAVPGVPFGNVQALGCDAVIIASRTMIKPVDQHGTAIRRLQHDLKQKPLTLYTTAGRALGALVDVYFDEQSGEVQGYEVTGGAFAAASFGKSFVPASQQVKTGIEILFVPAETATLMKESVGEPPDAPPPPSGKPEPGARKFFEAEPRALSAPQTVEDTHGRRARCPVQTEDGLIIAAQGQIVTDAVIEQARAHHAEQALKEAVVHPGARRMRGNNLSFLDRSRERMREEASHLTANTEKVWGKVKERVTQLVHRGGARRQEPSSATSEPPPGNPESGEQGKTETPVSGDPRP